MLDANTIKSFAPDFDGTFHIVDQIDSTNDYFKDEKNRLHLPSVCIAETQKKGRGRFDRHWHSPRGENIYFSLCYRFEKKMSELTGLSIVAGLAVSEAISSIVQIHHPILIKWPNDIVVDQKKISGILIEMESSSSSHCDAIIGIGINVNMLVADEHAITQPWTSLQKVSGKYIDRNLLSAQLIIYLTKYINRFIKKGLTDFIPEWQQKDFLLEKPVRILSGNTACEGVGAGIDSHGYLQLKMKNGEIRVFSSAETTLIKQ